MKPIIYVILGPTSSGKSEFAVKLAKQINGEIISCDSRQVYKYMDLGTGKVEGKYVKKAGYNKPVYIYKNIVHHGIDIASPKRQYSVTKFQSYCNKLIPKILTRGHQVILCGGTAHWIDAVIYDQKFPEVKPNYKLRKKLEKLPVNKLFSELVKLDKLRANSIDPKNKRRIIRALEIIRATKKPVPKVQAEEKYKTIWIGLSVNMEKLETKINKRLNTRIKQGMLKEIQKLKKMGLSWKKLESFGLEYRYGALLLQKRLSKKEFLEKLMTEIRRYAKRQLTWWKRNNKIKWINPQTPISSIKLR